MLSDCVILGLLLLLLLLLGLEILNFAKIATKDDKRLLGLTSEERQTDACKKIRSLKGPNLFACRRQFDAHI